MKMLTLVFAYKGPDQTLKHCTGIALTRHAFDYKCIIVCHTFKFSELIEMVLISLISPLIEFVGPL